MQIKLNLKRDMTDDNKFSFRKRIIFVNLSLLPLFKELLCDI